MRQNVHAGNCPGAKSPDAVSNTVIGNVLDTEYNSSLDNQVKERDSQLDSVMLSRLVT